MMFGLHTNYIVKWFFLFFYPELRADSLLAGGDCHVDVGGQCQVASTRTENFAVKFNNLKKLSFTTLRLHPTKSSWVNRTRRKIWRSPNGDEVHAAIKDRVQMHHRPPAQLAISNSCVVEDMSNSNIYEMRQLRNKSSKASRRPVVGRRFHST